MAAGVLGRDTSSEIMVAWVEEAAGVRSVLERAVLWLVECVPDINIFIIPLDDEFGIVEVVIDYLRACLCAPYSLKSASGHGKTSRVSVCITLGHSRLTCPSEKG